MPRLVKTQLFASIKPLSSAFIPVLTGVIVKKKEDAPKLMQNILGFQLIIIVPLCLLCILLAEPLMRHVLAEFRDVAQMELSAGLFRWVINYLLLISVSAVLMGVLNSHSRFVVPANQCSIAFHINIADSSVCSKSTWGSICGLYSNNFIYRDILYS